MRSQPPRRVTLTEPVDLAVVGEMREVAIARATEAITMAVLGHLPLAVFDYSPDA